MRETNYKNFKITALCHDGFLVENEEQNISFAFDPYDVKGEVAPVDYIFVSHSHFDHCDASSIRKLLGPKTKIVAPACCEEELKEFGSQWVTYAGEEKIKDDKVTYWAIPAYNIDKFRTPTEVFHPKELGGVRFAVEIPVDGSKNVRFYHAGDTDMIPEMESVKKIDVAFLPISGTFVMTLEEGIKAAEMIEADLTIPMHYGKILGSVAEANRFQNTLRGKTEVAVLSTESV